MQKIPFENLPSTDYPVNASNLNLMQNNMENAFKSEYSTSTKDTYNCNYINNNVAVKNTAAKCFRVNSAGTYRIRTLTYKGFLMFGIYNTVQFFAFCCVAASVISKVFINASQPSLQFTFVGNGVWDFVLPKNSEIDVICYEGMTIEKIS